MDTTTNNNNNNQQTTTTINNNNKTLYIDQAIEQIHQNAGPAYLEKFYSEEFGPPWLIHLRSVSDEDKVTVAHAKEEYAPLVYVRIWKCANNQVRFWMTGDLKASISASLPNNSTYQVFHMNKDKSKGYFHRIYSNALPKETSGAGKTVTNYHHREPCLVTAVRDPIEHFLSAYNEIEWVQKVHAKIPNVEIGTSFLSKELGSTERFHYFVWDMLQQSRIWRASPVLKHAFPMMRVLVPLDKFNLELSGYLPSLKNLSHTWPKFVAKTCPHSFPDSMVQENDPHHHQLPLVDMGDSSAGAHKSSGDPFGAYSAAKKARENGGPVVCALCIIHAYDYACWEDLPDGIPAICKEVYMSPSFRAIFDL